MKSQRKLGKKRVNNGIEGQAISLTALEDNLDLQFPLRFDMRGRTVGALVLGKGKELERLKFVFGFECRGIHSTLSTKQQNAVFDALESGLKDLPSGETMTIHFGSFSSDGDRQTQLSKVAAGAPSGRLKFLLFGEKQRTQELTKQGIRKPKFLRIYVTYTIDPKTSGAEDRTEKLLKQALKVWHSFTGQLEEIQQVHYESLFTKAFTDGFQIWEQLLSNKLGLDVKPMDEQQLWSAIWSRFNRSSTPDLPQVVTLSEQGMSETIHSDVHPTSMLIESQQNCPIADRSWVHVNGKYVAALTFQDKPAGWSSKFNQLRYLWDVVSRDSVSDTEVFCELSRANEALVKTNMQRLTKQSIVASDLASAKQSVDVVANLKTRRAVQAQEQLYDGSIPLYVGVVVLVHRKNLERLDEACRYLQSCIRRPAWIDRETEYAWLIWLQTLPITWDSMLATPFNRRMVYLTGEAPGFMPLVRPREGDRDGFELLTEEGGVPISIDVFNQHRNVAVLATTRAGKSVMISSWLTQALARKIPIVVLDFPTDTASTFKDYTTFVGKDQAAYFDIGTESNNLFEIPDLRSLPLAQQQSRMADYTSFLESALMGMILGNGVAQTAELLTLRKTVRSLISLLLGHFFADDEINARYQAAIAGGFGSPAWQLMPTMKDFLPFCNLNRVEIEAESLGDVAKAMEQIRLQLKFWLNSRVGKAISAPSSFRTDAPLLVFALRNLNEDDDAAILALSAYSAALRRALSSPASIFFIDESPILFRYEAIAELVARLCANGAKAGVRVFLSAQDPDTIAQSASASKILQNLQTRLVGRIQPTAIPSFVKYLGYPEEVISRNATESFFPKKEGVYSQWLLDDNGTYTYCRYYASYYQLAAVVNNPHEQRARDAFMAAYSDPYEGLAKFAQELVAALRDGREIRLPKPKSQPQFKPVQPAPSARIVSTVSAIDAA
jgi:hypothetical protein